MAVDKLQISREEDSSKMDSIRFIADIYEIAGEVDHSDAEQLTAYIKLCGRMLSQFIYDETVKSEFYKRIQDAAVAQEQKDFLAEMEKYEYKSGRTDFTVNWERIRNQIVDPSDLRPAREVVQPLILTQYLREMDPALTSEQAEQEAELTVRLVERFRFACAYARALAELKTDGSGQIPASPYFPSGCLDPGTGKFLLKEAQTAEAFYSGWISGCTTEDAFIQ